MQTPIILIISEEKSHENKNETFRIEWQWLCAAGILVTFQTLWNKQRISSINATWRNHVFVWFLTFYGFFVFSHSFYHSLVIKIELLRTKVFLNQASFTHDILWILISLKSGTVFERFTIQFKFLKQMEISWWPNKLAVLFIT